MEISSTSDSTSEKSAKDNGTSLRTRLTRGISAVIIILLVFWILTALSYKNVDNFLSDQLPENMLIAQSYEELSDAYSRVFEQSRQNIKNYASEPTYNEFSPNKIKTLLYELSLLFEQRPNSSIEKLKELQASFIKELSMLDSMVAERNDLMMAKIVKRTQAASHFREQVLELLNQFSGMLSDLNTITQNPDFTSLADQTLVNKIKRIQQDLINAETEISLYLSIRDGKEISPADPAEAQIAARRVENRLDSMLYLIRHSISDSTPTLQRRILSQILNKIESLLSYFSKLRNTMEAPADDINSIEIEIQKILNNLQKIFNESSYLLKTEADGFWSKIFEQSDQIKVIAARNHRILLSFLIIVLITGIYLNIVYPKKIGGPLNELNKQLKQYRLGSHIKKIADSGTKEIDSLSSAICIMTQRLNYQAEINRKYLESIHSHAKVFKELHVTAQKPDFTGERIEKPIDIILQQLISHCPNIDLVKVMVKKSIPEKTNTNLSKIVFKRIGNTQFSDRFKQSLEFLPYCNSIASNPDKPGEYSEEIIPIDAGLTGWYYENFPGIKTGTEESDFFQPVYSPQPVSNNPILKERDYECGLQGALLTEPLSENSSEEDDSGKSYFGLLFVYYLDQKIKLSWQEIFFIQIIASQIASIIETDQLLIQRDQKRRIDSQLQLAKEIQDNLLPQKTPTINGLKISSICKPAAEIGGDYYDFFKLSDKKLGIVIADASGKNVPAAIIMTVFKTTLSTMQIESMSPGEVLSRANNIIARNITNDRFITAMYVIIDSETGETQLASGGHNPAFVVSGHGMELTLHEKNVSCLPLGIMEDYNYTTVSFKLKKNDMLFVYTDGVTEARNFVDEEFTESGLKKFLARPRQDNPTKKLLEEIEDFAQESEQHDDITAVSVEFLGG